MQDFLLNYVLNIFDRIGLEDFPEDQKRMHANEFALQLEREIGNRFVPMLSADAMTSFVEMVDDPSTTVDTWKEFWYGAIPNFETELQQILSSFETEMKELFAE